MIIKGLAGDAMAEKHPPNDATAGINWDNDFRAKSVERPPHNRALPLIGCLPEVGARDQVPVQLKPAHERVPLAKFQFVGFGQTMPARTKTVTMSCSGTLHGTDHSRC